MSENKYGKPVVFYYLWMADFGEWLLSWPHPKLFVRKPFKDWGTK
jgi:hypothetical protein